MDECGNISTAEQIIQLVDSEFPQWDFFPADQTLECSASYTFVPATAIDNCAEPNVTWSADTIGDIETGMYDVVYAFEATDDCDNSISRSQVVRFVDTTAPEFTFVPNDFSIECSEAIAFEDALATDACSVATVTEERDTLIGNATGNFIITRTFTAVDVQAMRFGQHRQSLWKTPHHQNSHLSLQTLLWTAQRTFRWTCPPLWTIAVRSTSPSRKPHPLELAQ